MKKLFRRFSKKMGGFTLIELLIVIGILGVLAVAVLLALNPAEAQRKARDAERTRDISTLQAIISQALDDGVATSACLTSATGCTSRVAGQIQSQACSSNFLGINVCSYVNSVPLDPSNGQTRTVVSGAGLATVTGEYKVAAQAAPSTYEIGVYQESTSNRSKVTGDGGAGTNANTAVEAGSDLSLL